MFTVKNQRTNIIFLVRIHRFDVPSRCGHKLSILKFLVGRKPLDNLILKSFYTSIIFSDIHVAFFTSVLNRCQSKLKEGCSRLRTICHGLLKMLWRGVKKR